MPALPASSDFTGGAVTEGQFKTALTALRDYLSGLLGADGLNATALATLGALGAGYAAKTAAYTVVVGDRGKVLNCSGTWTLSLPAAATAGAGFSFAVRVETGTITIDPSGAELIDGSAAVAMVGGRSAWLISTGTEWLRMTMPKAQNTATDITADRLMAVGAFGLGAGVATLTDLTAEMAPGLYGFAEATAIGSPGTGSFSCTLLCMRVGTGGNFGFLAWRATTGTPKIWFGARTGTTGAITWTELWTKQTALGPVSQTAGVPTGAIIERGENANGTYVKFADGTMECLLAPATFVYSTADLILFTATFPAPFLTGSLPVVTSTLPSVTGDYTGLSRRDLSGFAQGAGTTIAVLSFTRPSGASRSFTTGDQVANVRLKAKGRWF